MSGLPEPYPPAGIGYSYLDWFGAYNVANAVLAALHRRATTGVGAHIDASQVEVGIFLSGTAVLDRSANGRTWRRYGNRSPYKLAAPHGIYRTQGDDRWIAISCFTDAQWTALTSVLALDERDLAGLETLDRRLRSQDELDELVSRFTEKLDGFELMYKLQKAGVAAGVCQSAQDRTEADPQLAYDEWRVELPQKTIGVWPVKEVPAVLSETPGDIGGHLGRSGPDYGEHTEEVLSRVLGMSSEEIARLREIDVV
jgi:crotonobetainyl-CoA:carnitine CoA-transferase CaiB-like acyl-CoA transferase